MLRISTPRLGISVAVIGTSVAAASFALAVTGPAESAPATTTAAHQAAPLGVVDEQQLGDVSAASAARFWTLARMRAAKTVPLPKLTGSAAAARPLAGGADVPAADVPPAPLADGVQAAGGVSAQAVVHARQWPNQRSSAARTTGRLFFTGADGRSYACSATVVSAPNRHSVWTAAHCLHSGGPRGRWHRNLLFVPGYRDGRAPFGRYTARHLVVGKPWTRGTNLAYRLAHDIGGFTVRPAGGKQIQQRTGGQGITWGYKGRAYFMRALGYPTAFLPSGKPTQGHRLYYCGGRTTGALLHAKAPVSLALRCTMGFGASGGPWVYGMNSGGWGKIAGVTTGHAAHDTRMYAPYQGAMAANIYTAIKKR